MPIRREPKQAFNLHIVIKFGVVGRGCHLAIECLGAGIHFLREVVQTTVHLLHTHHLLGCGNKHFVEQMFALPNQSFNLLAFTLRTSPLHIKLHIFARDGKNLLLDFLHLRSQVIIFYLCHIFLFFLVPNLTYIISFIMICAIYGCFERYSINSLSINSPTYLLIVGPPSCIFFVASSNLSES